MAGFGSTFGAGVFDWLCDIAAVFVSFDSLIKYAFQFPAEQARYPIYSHTPCRVLAKRVNLAGFLFLRRTRKPSGPW
jgi:hypothetical protein